jgi:adenine phosphoribosyltransferase
MAQSGSNESPLSDFIVSVRDYPKPGIVFKDITPLLADGQALATSITTLAQSFPSAQTDLVAGIEARGFILGAAVAAEIGVGFIPLRKPGKSPREVHTVRYELEYGFDELQVHKDLIREDMKIVVIDDVLATGGTAVAAIELIRKAGGTVTGFGCLLELGFLAGRSRIESTYPGISINALVQQ